jgi:hypothetical protein
MYLLGDKVRMLTFNSRNLAFVSWLADQPPRDELIMRLAIRDKISDPLLSLQWGARIAALEDIIRPTPDEWEDIFHDVRDRIERLWNSEANQTEAFGD